jgi:hypothetical protein
VDSVNVAKHRTRGAALFQAPPLRGELRSPALPKLPPLVENAQDECRFAAFHPP